MDRSVGDSMKICGVEVVKFYGVIPVKIMGIALSPQPEPENYPMDDLHGKRGIRSGIMEVDT